MEDFLNCAFGGEKFPSNDIETLAGLKAALQLHRWRLRDATRVRIMARINRLERCVLRESDAAHQETLAQKALLDRDYVQALYRFQKLHNRLSGKPHAGLLLHSVPQRHVAERILRTVEFGQHIRTDLHEDHSVPEITWQGRFFRIERMGELERELIERTAGQLEHQLLDMQSVADQREMIDRLDDELSNKQGIDCAPFLEQLELRLRASMASGRPDGRPMFEDRTHDAAPRISFSQQALGWRILETAKQEARHPGGQQYARLLSRKLEREKTVPSGDLSGLRATLQASQ